MMGRMSSADGAVSAGTVSVGIVADDLTGANDSAVQFGRRGWNARLTLTDPSSVTVEAGAVIAVVTDSRAQDATAARASTLSAVAALRTAGIDRLFVKIDSTMRGSVADQVSGALDAWGNEHPDAFAIVCPAYPAMGRTVENGRLLVNGEGVETTSVGRDPVTPVRTNVLGELIPQSVNIAIDGDGLIGRIESAVRDGARVLTVDAITAADVRSIADAILELGPRAIPVGSAGLAVEMADVWGSTTPAAAPSPASGGRVIVVISSLHDVSRSQHTHLVATAFADQLRTLAPSLDDLRTTDAAAAWIANELAVGPELPAVVAVLAPAERSAETAGDTTGDTIAMRVAAGLAVLTDAVITQAGAGSLVLVGGEGARAVLDRFGAASIRVTDAIREGIPIGVIEGGRLNGLTVVTKAGGFGTPSSLSEIVPELLTTLPKGEHS
jgi:uncharacterized protein YgbK (DUF1537 family)